MEAAPLVVLAMGSRSDWSVVEHTATTLDELGVAYEARVVSAHRTPHLMPELTAWAEGAGHGIVGLEVRKPSLEDHYLALVSANGSERIPE